MGMIHDSHGGVSLPSWPHVSRHGLSRGSAPREPVCCTPILGTTRSITLQFTAAYAGPTVDIFPVELCFGARRCECGTYNYRFMHQTW